MTIMADTKRFYVGNLFANVEESDLTKLFSKFGSVDKVDIKTKSDIDGNIMTTFAFVTVGSMAEDCVSKCIQAYNNLKWKKHVIKVQQAQESFLTRLQKEREVAASKASKMEAEDEMPKKSSTISNVDVDENAKEQQKSTLNYDPMEQIKAFQAAQPPR
jgi:RNA recognition motif-containing protein